MTARNDYPTAAYFVTKPDDEDDDLNYVVLARNVAAMFDELDLLRAALTELEAARGNYGPASRSQTERRP